MSALNTKVMTAFALRGLDQKLAALGVGLRNQTEVVETADQRAERYARQQARRKKTLELIRHDRNAKRAAIRRRKARRMKLNANLQKG